jgi:hypothetical protein
MRKGGLDCAWSRDVGGGTFRPSHLQTERAGYTATGTTEDLALLSFCHVFGSKHAWVHTRVYLMFLDEGQGTFDSNLMTLPTSSSDLLSD